MSTVLKAPFPYPGGKAAVADEVWERFGNVDNFCEPFAGSLAVLLRRPNKHFRSGIGKETINDKNHFVANFWRAVKNDPDGVAKHADNPVFEADLHARHQWLVRSEESLDFRERFVRDPNLYDSKIAGWWAWGQSCWIASAWCDEGVVDHKQRPELKGDRGVTGNGGLSKKRPELSGKGTNCTVTQKRPNLSAGPAGVMLGSTISVDDKQRSLQNWMKRLSDRLQSVRTCYGHWARICDSDTTITKLGMTGIFLDPPYPGKSVDGKESRSTNLYSTDRQGGLDELRDEVLAWCQEWGTHKRVRIAVCGLEGDGYEELEKDGWSVLNWETAGGYGNMSQKRDTKSENSKRERIWFSPFCIDSKKPWFDKSEES